MKDVIDFLTSVPGILIVCGVVLLIIALILFIVGNKKDKVSTEEVVEDKQESEPTVVEENNEVVPVEPVAVEEPVQVEPVVETQEEVKVEEPVVEAPVVEEPTFNSVPEEPVAINEAPVEIPVSEPTEIPTEMPVEMPTMPAFTEQPVEPVQPVAINEPTVYGGASPIFDIKMEEEKPVSIYGGNDPLEKTQSIPKVEEHHAPYGMDEPVSIPEPAFTAVPEQPVEITTPEPVVPTFEKNDDIEEL